MKKMLCLLLAAALLAAAAGCAKEKSDAPAENGNENQQQNSEETTQTLPEVVLTDYDKQIVMTVGGKEIPAALYRYYLVNLRSQYDSGDSTMWDNEEMAQYVDDQVLSYIKEYAAAEVMAEKLSVTVPEKTKEELNTYMAQVMNEIDADENTSYEAELAAANMTDNMFREFQHNYLLQSQIYTDKYKGTATDEQILDYVHQNYVRVKHILIKTVDLDDEQKAEARSRADQVLERAKNGENFEDLVTEYSEDGMDVDTGYYFTTGEMVQEFEDKSFELQEGEISDIVESTYGYHIIKKYPMDDSYILGDETIREAAEERICGEDFSAALKEVADGLEVVYAEDFDAIRAQILEESAGKAILQEDTPEAGESAGADNASGGEASDAQ